MISHDNKNTTLTWRHQWCLLPWNDAKDLTLKLRVAKTGEEEQRAPAKRQRRKRQERRQEAQKDFGDFGVKQIWSKGEKCGNMVHVDDLDEMEIHADWVGGEVLGGTCIRSCGPNSQQLFFPGVSAGGAIGFVWAYRFEMNHHPDPGWLISLLFPWLQVLKINMQLKMQTCQRLGREFFNLSRLLWFVFPFFNMTRWEKGWGFPKCCCYFYVSLSVQCTNELLKAKSVPTCNNQPGYGQLGWMGRGRRRQEDQELGRQGHLFLVGAKRQLPLKKSRISNKSTNNIEIFLNLCRFNSFNPNMPMMETFQFWSWLLHQLQSASCLNTCPISVQRWIQKEDANPRVDGFVKDCSKLLASKLKLFRVISDSWWFWNWN